ncbi:protein phosphatase 2C, putative [Plasmodium relictum]|uniref:protein-serine/threonine phosphatase n=1 Tax=Plasmodium relictum TaxID=85471 RepID=A0A1J1HFC0_PLARL|nr:protein phosphatase 2C, putative [Plasmodium relictum]CRH04088.1 protein phosphatase 2C, putative [Plasmodium relictum]
MILNNELNLNDYDLDSEEFIEYKNSLLNYKKKFLLYCLNIKNRNKYFTINNNYKKFKSTALYIDENIHSKFYFYENINKHFLKVINKNFNTLLQVKNYYIELKYAKCIKLNNTYIGLKKVKIKNTKKCLYDFFCLYDLRNLYKPFLVFLSSYLDKSEYSNNFDYIKLLCNIYYSRCLKLYEFIENLKLNILEKYKLKLCLIESFYFIPNEKTYHAIILVNLENYSIIDIITWRGAYVISDNKKKLAKELSYEQIKSKLKRIKTYKNTYIKRNNREYYNFKEKDLFFSDSFNIYKLLNIKENDNFELFYNFSSEYLENTKTIKKNLDNLSISNEHRRKYGYKNENNLSYRNLKKKKKSYSPLSYKLKNLNLKKIYLLKKKKNMPYMHLKANKSCSMKNKKKQKFNFRKNLLNGEDLIKAHKLITKLKNIYSKFKFNKKLLGLSLIRNYYYELKKKKENIFLKKIKNVRSLDLILDNKIEAIENQKLYKIRKYLEYIRKKKVIKISDKFPDIICIYSKGEFKIKIIKNSLKKKRRNVVEKNSEKIFLDDLNKDLYKNIRLSEREKRNRELIERVATTEINKHKEITNLIRKKKKVYKAWIILKKKKVYELKINDTMKIGEIIIKIVRFEIGKCCTRGIRKNLEDRFNLYENVRINENDKLICSFIGIYDGYNGLDCVEYIKKKLVKNFQKQVFYICGDIILSENIDNDIKLSIYKTFKKTDDDFLYNIRDNNKNSGSTAIILLILNQFCYIINCGDSKALLIKKNEEFFLSRSHKPYSHEEYKRILLCESYVRKNKIEGKLSITRSFGNYKYKTYKRNFFKKFQNSYFDSNRNAFVKFNLNGCKNHGISSFFLSLYNPILFNTNKSDLYNTRSNNFNVSKNDLYKTYSNNISSNKNEKHGYSIDKFITGDFSNMQKNEERKLIKNDIISKSSNKLNAEHRNNLYFSYQNKKHEVFKRKELSMSHNNVINKFFPFFKKKINSLKENSHFIYINEMPENENFNIFNYLSVSKETYKSIKNIFKKNNSLKKRKNSSKTLQNKYKNKKETFLNIKNVQLLELVNNVNYSKLNSMIDNFIDYNFYKKQLVICFPDIKKLKLTKNDDFFFLSSDGLFDVLNAQKIINYIKSSQLKKIKFKKIVKNIVKYAVKVKKCKDNITIILLNLKHQKRSIL